MSSSNPSSILMQQGPSSSTRSYHPRYRSTSTARIFTTADLDVRYRRLKVLGEGTYGVVYEAVHVPSGRKVALKKIRTEETEELMEQVGIPTTAIRETVLLRELHHPNIVELFETAHIGAQLWLSFELCEIDLRHYLKQKLLENKRLDKRDKSKPFLPLEQCKRLSYQLLSGLAYCHSRRIIHRDLKPQNVLLDKLGTKLKIADFGLARTFTSPSQTNTHEVVTLWYRAPELLLGEHHYTSALDLWSVGCIVAEMVTGRPIFHGDSEIDTLFRIFRTLGTPMEPHKNEEDDCNMNQMKHNYNNSSHGNGSVVKPNSFKAGNTAASARSDTTQSSIWKGVSKLRYYQDAFPSWNCDPLQSLQQAIPAADPQLLDLLKQIFHYEPSRRPTALKALQHPWFLTS